MFEKIGILGGGHMGSDLFGLLSKGHAVTLWARRQEVVDELREKHLGPLERRAAKPGDRGDAARAQLARLKLTTDLDDLADSDLIIETVIEDVAIKVDLFKRLGPKLKPEAVITSNSSYTIPSELAPTCPHPERFAGLHFFFPSKFVPFIEIIPHPGTAPVVTDALIAFVNALGKRPLLVGREVVAFLVNRVLGPWYTEALHVFGEGYHKASVIDAAIKGKLAMIGAIEGVDQIGADVMYIGEVRFPHEKRPGDTMPSILPWLMAEGRNGTKVGKGCYDYVDGKPVDVEGMPRSFPPEGDPGPYPLQDALDRMYYSVLLESYRVLTMGVGTREDIDWCLQQVLGLKEGPFQFSDRVGIDAVKVRLAVLQEKFGSRFNHRGLLDG